MRLPAQLGFTLLHSSFTLQHYSGSFVQLLVMCFHPLAVMAGGVAVGFVAGEVRHGRHKDEASNNQPAKINRNRGHRVTARKRIEPRKMPTRTAMSGNMIASTT